MYKIVIFVGKDHKEDIKDIEKYLESLGLKKGEDFIIEGDGIKDIELRDHLELQGKIDDKTLCMVWAHGSKSPDGSVHFIDEIPTHEFFANLAKKAGRHIDCILFSCFGGALLKGKLIKDGINLLVRSSSRYETSLWENRQLIKAASSKIAQDVPIPEIFSYMTAHDLETYYLLSDKGQNYNLYNIFKFNLSEIQDIILNLSLENYLNPSNGIEEEEGIKINEVLVLSKKQFFSIGEIEKYIPRLKRNHHYRNLYLVLQDKLIEKVDPENIATTLQLRGQKVEEIFRRKYKEEKKDSKEEKKEVVKEYLKEESKEKRIEGVSQSKSKFDLEYEGIFGLTLHKMITRFVSRRVFPELLRPLFKHNKNALLEGHFDKCEDLLWEICRNQDIEALGIFVARFKIPSKLDSDGLLKIVVGNNDLAFFKLLIFYLATNNESMNVPLESILHHAQRFDIIPFLCEWANYEYDGYNSFLETLKKGSDILLRRLSGSVSDIKDGFAEIGPLDINNGDIENLLGEIGIINRVIKSNPISDGDSNEIIDVLKSYHIKTYPVLLRVAIPEDSRFSLSPEAGLLSVIIKNSAHDRKTIAKLADNLSLFINHRNFDQHQWMLAECAKLVALGHDDFIFLIRKIASEVLKYSPNVILNGVFIESMKSSESLKKVRLEIEAMVAAGKEQDEDIKEKKTDEEEETVYQKKSNKILFKNREEQFESELINTAMELGDYNLTGELLMNINPSLIRFLNQRVTNVDMLLQLPSHLRSNIIKFGTVIDLDKPAADGEKFIFKILDYYCYFSRFARADKRAAAESEDLWQEITLLLSSSSQLNALNKDGNGLLKVASMRGKSQMVKLLLYYGAFDPIGQVEPSAIKSAILENRFGTVVCLAENGHKLFSNDGELEEIEQIIDNYKKLYSEKQKEAIGKIEGWIAKAKKNKAEIGSLPEKKKEEKDNKEDKKEDKKEAVKEGKENKAKVRKEGLKKNTKPSVQLPHGYTLRRRKPTFKGIID